VLLFAAAPLPRAADDAVTKERLESFLADEADHPRIVATFRRHPGATLPFIDEYLEGALAEIEKSGADSAGSASVTQSFRRGLKFAELADRAFQDSIFTEYAGNFASWSPSEQKRFREGQKLFREGKETFAKDPAAALSLYRKSIGAAEPLGDHWGVAMGQLAAAQACQKLGRFDEGHSAVLRSIDLLGRLQLRDAYVKALVLCADLRRDLKFPDSGAGQLRMALNALPDDADPAKRKEIVDALCAAFEKMGRADEAEKIRASERARKGE
jgi:hypothetical protein